MSLIVQTVIIGILAFIIRPFSTSAAESVIWVGYLLFAVGLLWKGLSDRKNGNASDWTSGAMLPPAMIAVLILLAISYFYNFNKFHLLWATNLVVFIIETIISKRVVGPWKRSFNDRIKKASDSL